MKINSKLCSNQERKGDAEARGSIDPVADESAHSTGE